MSYKMMDYLFLPSTHPEKFTDNNEAQSGLKHRDFVHQIELLSDPTTTRPNQLKALRILEAVLPGQEESAELFLRATEILRQFIYSDHKGLVLHTLCCLNSLIITEDLAQKEARDIPRLAEFLHPDEEPPLREESAKLLQIVAEFIGPVTQFLSGAVPKQLVNAISCRQSTAPFLLHAFRLLSRLANNQTIRIPLIDSIDFLTVLVRTFSNPELRQSAIVCASNIAMDPSHRGKIALLNADILLSISAFLESTDPQVRYAILSLIALLAVPKDGKHKISTDRDLPDLINNIAKDDEDESCREAAAEVRVLVSELPLGKAILGGQKLDQSGKLADPQTDNGVEK